MKNKFSKYILIPVVIIIWGVVVFKFISNFSGKKVNTVAPKFLLDSNNNKHKIDTFNLIANYNDPFLKHQYIVRSEISDAKKLKEKKTIIPISKNRLLKWPIIQYGGIVDNKKRTLICLLNINKNDYIMKKGDVNDQVTLMEIYKDSVRVQYSSELKTIMKQTK